MDTFWSKVKGVGTDGCWEWTGAKLNGYGGFKFTGKMWYAHRFSYTLRYGTIPAGLCVMHICDNKSCVNPSHLTVGTDKDNSDDKIAKGRHRFIGSPPGEGSAKAVLTCDQVIEARKLYKTGEYSQRSLSQKFGVGHNAMACLLKNKTWRHLVCQES